MLGVPRLAQAAFPDRPIHLVVPFAPGGNADVVGHIVDVATPEEMTAQGFGAYIKAEYERSAAAAKLAGLTPK
jgi:tripartite-type tricarboxylate transporter receptor subunit TctC